MAENDLLRRLGWEATLEIGRQALALLLGLPLMASVGAATTAFFTGQSWVVIYLVAWGAFAYGAAAALFITLLRDRFSIFRKITLVDALLKHGALTGATLDNLTVHGVLENRSKATIYALNKRAILTLQSKTGSDLQYPTEVHCIDPGTKAGFVFQKVDGVNVAEEAKGYIDLEVHYGRLETKPKFAYECRLEIALMGRQVAPGEYEVSIAHAIRHESHRKI